MTALDSLLDAARAAQAGPTRPIPASGSGSAILDEAGAVPCRLQRRERRLPGRHLRRGRAIAAMVAAGGRRIAAILVLGDGDALVTPCGACRQRIREFAAPDTSVHVAGPGGLRRSFTLDELLPASFGPDNLA